MKKTGDSIGIAIKEEKTTGKCQHFWSIDPVGRAVCRKCGARVEFFNSIYAAMKAKYPNQRRGFGSHHQQPVLLVCDPPRSSTAKLENDEGKLPQNSAEAKNRASTNSQGRKRELAPAIGPYNDGYGK